MYKLHLWLMIAENVVTLVNLMIILRMYGILYKQLENFDVKSLIFHEYLECIYRYDILSLGSSIRSPLTQKLTCMANTIMDI